MKTPMKTLLTAAAASLLALSGCTLGGADYTVGNKPPVEGGAGGGAPVGGTGGGSPVIEPPPPPVNMPPVLDVIAPVSVVAGMTNTVTLAASDPDNDGMTFALVNAPAWVTLSGAVVTVAPGLTDVGAISVNVTVTDGVNTVAGKMDIGVDAAPRCDYGKVYTGFAGTELVAGRVDNDQGQEIRRVKPFSALTTEYPRVLGNTPGLIAGSASTFGNVPARFSEEPTANAVSLYQSYRIAFQGCLTVTTGTGAPAKYASVPSNTTAETECKAWSRKFWSRDATTAEIASCVNVAMVDTTKETDPKRRWAYTCASVLTAAGFMTY